MQDGTDASTVEAPEDYAAFEEWRNTGKAPEAVEEETPAADEAKTPPPTSESGNPSGEEDEQPGEKGKGVQKRIDELTKARRDAERRAEEAERKLAETQGSRPADKNAPAAPAVVEGKPKLEDFNTLEEFQEALTDWKIDQRETARESKAREEAGKTAWTERETTFKSEHADYDEVLEKIAIPAKSPALHAIQAAVAKGGPELLYHLGQNPEEATRIAGLPPVDAVLELGQIMAGFKGKAAGKSTPEKPPQKLSSAPKPPARVGGAAPAAKAIGDSDLNYEEHEKLMAARDKRRR